MTGAPLACDQSCPAGVGKPPWKLTNPARSAPARAARFRSLVEAACPDLSGGFHFIDSPRHDTYVEHGAFRAEVENVRKRMRWPKPHRGLLSPGSSRSFS